MGHESFINCGQCGSRAQAYSNTSCWIGALAASCKVVIWMILSTWALQEEDLPTIDALNLTAPTRELDRKRIDEFTITSDLAHGRSFFVEGEAVLRFAQMTNWSYYESLLRFQKVLELSGMPSACSCSRWSSAHADMQKFAALHKYHIKSDSQDAL